MSVISNATRTGVVVTASTATETIDLSTLIIAGETLKSVEIAGVVWSGTWTVVRGGVTVLSLTGSGNWGDLDALGISLKANPTSNIVLTLTGAGTIILRLKKVVSGYTTQY